MGRYDLEATPVTELDARLTLGIKGPNGAPTDKDRFTVTLPGLVKRTFRSAAGKEFGGEVHPPHPAFERWHKEATLEERRSLEIVIESASIDRAIQIGRAAPKATDGRETPSKGDWCRSTGRGEAERWDFVKNAYEPLACGQDACPQARICKPKIVIRARLVWSGRWAGLPEVRFLLKSRGWGTSKGGLGIVGELDEVWLGHVCGARGIPVPSPDTPETRRAAGLPDWLATGLRLRLELRDHAKGDKRWWAVHTSMPGTIEGWLASQGQRIAVAAPVVAEVPAVEPVSAEEREVDDVFGGEPVPELTPKQRQVVEYLGRPSCPVSVALACARVGRQPHEWTVEDIATIKGMIEVQWAQQREVSNG